MTDFDQAARFAAKRLDPPGFLAWILEGFSWAAWRWTGWLDTQTVAFPGEPELRPDIVPTFERQANDAPPLAVIIEVMSEVRWIILDRLAEYAYRVRRELPYQTSPAVSYSVIGFVVNLTGSMESGELSIAPPDCGDLGLWARMKPRNLSTMSASATLAEIDSGRLAKCVLPWVSLMSGGGEPTTIEEWKRLALTETDEEKRRAYAGLVQVFAELSGCDRAWEKGLEGWNMKRSRIVLEWQREAAVETKRADVLRTLQVRFGGPVPPDITQVIENQNEITTLDTWFDRALTASSLDEMRPTLGLNGA
jgi:hypothetical protein